MAILDEGSEFMACFTHKSGPCSLKKSERHQPNQSVDDVLTTREPEHMTRADNVVPTRLPESDCDSPQGSGAGMVVPASVGTAADPAPIDRYFHFAPQMKTK